MQKPLGWHRVERGVERWVGDKTFFDIHGVLCVLVKLILNMPLVEKEG